MKKTPFKMTALLFMLALCCFSCGKKQQLTVSKNEVTFASSGGVAMVQVDADCDWTVEYNGDHEWYTLSRLSGSNQGVILVNVDEHHSHNGRQASFNVNTSNRKVKRMVAVVQKPVDIVDITNKVWFLHEYERWATDFYDEYIEDSYQHWNYYIDETFDNWFLYFKDENEGYQYHTKNGDTTIYRYEYTYYPLGDSLYINFETDSTEVEDYHAIIHELSNRDFIFSDEYHPHQFEKLFMANVSTSKVHLNINPTKFKKKQRGPLIQIEP